MEDDGKVDWEIEVDADLLEMVRPVLAMYGMTPEEYAVLCFEMMIACNGIPAFFLPSLLNMVLEQGNITDENTVATVRNAMQELYAGRRIPYDNCIAGICDRYRVPKDSVFIQQ